MPPGPLGGHIKFKNDRQSPPQKKYRILQYFPLYMELFTISEMRSPVSSKLGAKVG